MQLELRIRQAPAKSLDSGVKSNMLIVQSPATDESADLDQTSRDDIIVRRPSELDVSGLAALFSEMQSHYGRPVSDERPLMAARLACTPPV